MSTEEILKAIKEGLFDGELSESKESTNKAVQEKVDTAQILNDAIMPAIKDIGESMEEGDFFMPEVKIAAKALQAVAEILRAHVIGEDLANYTAPKWMGEGDIDDIGIYLKKIEEEGRGLSAQEQMGIMDMIAIGLDTHEFAPCKIQAKESDKN